MQECVVSLPQSGSSAIEEKDFEASLQAYDRVRRELGLALREWERGRATLQSYVEQHRPRSAIEEEEREADGDARQDEQLSSGESDKTMVNVDEELKAELKETGEEDTGRIDDVTAHLLNTSSVLYLPPPGIEQVFESLSAPPQFNRPRSNLSREERIALAKARRESKDVPLSMGVPENGCVEKKPVGWGPGGEVVEELKDVIWKVSEQRRRRMTARTLDINVPHDTA